MSKVFWKPAAGLKADIERHNAKIAEYSAKIAELESQNDPLSIASKKVYQRFIAHVMNSRDMLANQIGKKK